MVFSMENAMNNKEYTYKDYLNWTGEDRIELIEGVVWSKQIDRK